MSVVSSNADHSCSKAMMVNFRLVRIHFGHNMKRIQICDFLAFSIGLYRLGGSENFRPPVQGG